MQNVRRDGFNKGGKMHINTRSEIPQWPPVRVWTLPSCHWTALWRSIFSFRPHGHKPLLVSPLLSSGHPWVRTVITGVVTAEPLGSTTDWVPPGRSRHVSRFPGPKCNCVCVCVLCVENEKCCVVTFCGPEAPRVTGEETSLTCILSIFLHHRRRSVQRSWTVTQLFFLSLKFACISLQSSSVTFNSSLFWRWNNQLCTSAPCLLK